MIVVDASVLAPALADDGTAGASARARLGNERLTAPELIDLETVSVLQGLNLSGVLEGQRAAQALVHLRQLPITRVAHRELLPRCWELRHNLTPYDAAYVALAENLGVRLVTADTRLARASGPTCQIEVLS